MDDKKNHILEVAKESRDSIQEQENVWINVDGKKYPSICVDGDWTAEAYLHQEDTLPHQMMNMETYFPLAQAAPDPGDKGPSQTDSMMERGLEIGLRKSKHQQKSA